MKNSWNSFWKDYRNLAGTSIRFCRNHWLGMLILTLATFGSYIVWLVTYVNGGFDDLCICVGGYVDVLRAWMKKLFHKGEHEKK